MTNIMGMCIKRYNRGTYTRWDEKPDYFSKKNCHTLMAQKD